MKTNMYAYQLLAKFEAGLLLCGQDNDGELEWLGSREQFQRAAALESEILTREPMPF